MTELLTQLEATLQAENTALRSHDVEALEVSSAKKAELCAQLADGRFGPSLTAAIDELSSADRQECESAHKSALVLAAQVKDSNLVNGMALNRAHTSVREIINMMGGRQRDGLYGETGQPAGHADRFGAIAKA